MTNLRERNQRPEAEGGRRGLDLMRLKFRSELHLCLCFTVALCALSTFCGQAQQPAPKMTFLDNGEVRIGMDLALGGAVTFISSKDHPGNIINSADLGRQIQMSHYSGPWPFEVGDKKPNPAWAGLGWNPIQTGDCYMNPSKVIEHRNDGKELYIKCIPMQWPLNNVPGDCLFETWTTLEGPVIHMRYRCTNQRSDKTAYRPCPQELPAVYTISKLWRLMSYTGNKPFTQDTLTQVTNDWRKPWPWTRFVATERWAALVDNDGWGLGVFKDDGGEFHGGIHGDDRSDDPKHGSTAYVAPIHMENFDHNIVYEHQHRLRGRQTCRHSQTLQRDGHQDAARLALCQRPAALDDAQCHRSGLPDEWRMANQVRCEQAAPGKRCSVLASRKRSVCWIWRSPTTDRPRPHGFSGSASTTTNTTPRRASAWT